ncbi:MAG: hydroxymethylbilane synthase [Woeseiaceae bacterium]|nr:hydroxymethylbilane synthase [Woeseiaceae bacterium]
MSQVSGEDSGEDNHLKIRIATRKSALALWQAEHVADLLRQTDGVDTVELVPLSTKGDEILDRSLQKIGGKGLFIKELEIAMADGRADIAVHSMKDVPADMPEGFTIACVLKRANHADALVGGKTFDQLPEAALVGSSSLRRQAQLKMMRPDLRIEPLRGNVNTRLAKLEAGDYDAIILAAAGLERLGLDHHIAERFDPDQMLPAAAQGVVGIECRDDRQDLLDLLQELNDPVSSVTTSAERAIAFRLQANCQSPVASFATVDGDSLTLTALVASPDGSRSLKKTLTGSAQDARGLGESLAEQLIEGGAMDILAETVHA